MELARLFRAFAEGSVLELVALKAISVVCIYSCYKDLTQDLNLKIIPPVSHVDLNSVRRVSLRSFLLRVEYYNRSCSSRDESLLLVQH